MTIPSGGIIAQNASRVQILHSRNQVNAQVLSHRFLFLQSLFQVGKTQKKFIAYSNFP